MENKNGEKAAVKKRIYVCGECGAEFASKRDLRHHVAVQHYDKPIEKEAEKDALAGKIHKFVKWNVERNVVIAWYVSEEDLQEEWKEALGEGGIGLREFVDGLERLKKIYSRFGRYLDYKAYTDKQGGIRKVAVAFDDPREYEKLWDGDDCLAASPLGRGWIIVDFCGKDFGIAGDIMSIEATKWFGE